MPQPLIVGIGGTTRPNSSVEALVKVVLAECQSQGARVLMFGSAELAALPHYGPEPEGRSSGQQALVDAVRAADGLVIGSPGYHSGISGLVKNAIDLLEDTRLDQRPYLDDLPVGLIVSAAGWQAGGVTLSALRNVVHALRGWPTPIGISVNTLAQKIFSDLGEIVDLGLKSAIEGQARQLMTRAAPRGLTADFIPAGVQPAGMTSSNKENRSDGIVGAVEVEV